MGSALIMPEISLLTRNPVHKARLHPALHTTEPLFEKEISDLLKELQTSHHR